MKKLISVFSFIVVLLLVFTACEAHEHDYSDDWSSDADYHWHECTAVDGCPEVSDKADHDFEVVEDENGNPKNKCKVCGYTNDNVNTAPAHDHVFAEEYSISENFHWYACTVEGCYEKEDKIDHAYGNPEVEYTDGKMIITSVCVDCQYEKIEEQAVKTEVDDALSWDNAFKNFKLTNFTMDVYFEDLTGEERQHNHCVVTDDAVFYSIPGSTEFYSVKNADGTCTTYAKYGSSEVYIILDDTSDNFLTSAQRETVILISFEDNFDKFTYDEATGSYVCEEVIYAQYYDFSGEEAYDMYCYNNVVKITDGQISYISAEYYFDEKDLEYELKHFIYANIGISAVEIPQSVINNAVYEENIEE